MTTKITEKTNDLIEYILETFKHSKKNDVSTLNYIRKGCEAMCKIIIMKKKGESDGLDIINGRINKFTFARNNNPKGLDLFNLIDTCKYHNWFDNSNHKNDKWYHKFDDLRYGGNLGSHDNDDVNLKPTNDDIEYCIVIFKDIIKWFWENKLITQFPNEVGDALSKLEIDETFLVKENLWDEITDLCDNFNSSTKNFLISPEKFENITTDQLLILSKINWSIIFDFNIESKVDGLYKSFEGNFSKNIRPITIEQLGSKNIVSSSKYALNWVFSKGINQIPTTCVNNYKEWRTKKYTNLMEQVIKEYINSSSPSHLNIIVFDYDINFIEKIIEYISDNYSQTLLNIVVFSADSDKYFQIIEKFDNIKIFNLSLVDFVNNVDSFIQSKNIDITSIQVPAKKDEKETFIDIRSKYLSYLDKDIEILHKTIHIGENDDSLSFYKGGIIKWAELSNETEVRRDIERELFEKVNAHLSKESGKGPIVELFHKPGSGGTTLSRKIGFILKDKYPVVLINKYKRGITSQGLFDLSESTKKPILAIVESHNINVNDLNSLIRENNASKKHFVYLYLQRYYKKASNKKNQSEIYLKDSMQNIEERERFVSKFSINIPSKQSFIKNLSSLQPSECEVIDFSITAFEEDFSKSKIIDYVKSYLNQIPQNQKEFIIYSCLYYYYTQSSLSEFWFYKKFINKSLSKELTSDSVINKLLIREKDEANDYNGFWRPRYNQFAKVIISICLDTTEKGNWKDFLEIWSCKFIIDCKESNEFLIEELREAFKKMFFLRNNEDVIGLDNIDENNNKFSQLINDVKESNQQKSIFNCLTKSYPNESHFRAHYGRFLFEKQESEADLQLAKEEISEAIDLGQDDYNLWHLKGMCNRKNIEFKINKQNNLDNSESEYFFHWLKGETEEAQNYFATSKEIRSDNLHCHTAEIQMLIRVINFAKQKLFPNVSINTFLTMSENIWYENQFNKILELIEEANYIIELSTDMENAKQMNKAKNMIEDGEAKIYRLLGDITKSIDKYKQLSLSAHNSSRPYFRKMFVMSMLASKVNGDMRKLKQAWGLINEFERKEILKQIESNIHDQPEVSSNYKIWIQCVRYNTTYISLEDVINKIKIWYDNSMQNRISHLESTYYNYVFNAIDLIEREESLNEIQLNKTLNFIRECKEITTNDKFNFEWFGKGEGAKRILNYVELGSMRNDGLNLFEDDSKLQEVEGVIITIDDRQKGKIKLKCGLEAFFVPAIGKFEKGKDETLSVKFFISFRYDGLQAWQVKRKNENIEEIITVKEVDELKDNEIQKFDLHHQKNNKVELESKRYIEISKPKIVGKIDVSKFKKK